MRVKVWDNLTQDYVMDNRTLEKRAAAWPSYESAMDWIRQEVSDGASPDRYEVWEDEF